MRLKIGLAAALLASVGVGLPALAQAKTIGVSISHFDENFLTIVRDGISEEGKAKGVTLQVEDAQGDIGRQINEVQNFISQHVDAIIVNAVDSSEGKKLNALALKAGIPLVYVNRGPSDATLPQGIAFVASDNRVAGRIQGEELARLLHGKGNVVVMEGELSDEATAQRTAGLEEVFSRHPDIKIIQKQTANYQRNEALDLMTNWLTGGQKIDAVAANNDEMAIGAIFSLQQNHAAPGIVVGGVDATHDGLEQVAKGKLITVFQDGRTQGKVAVDKALQLASGDKTASGPTLVPFQLVTQANYQDFLKR